MIKPRTLAFDAMCFGGALLLVVSTFFGRSLDWTAVALATAALLVLIGVKARAIITEDDRTLSQHADAIEVMRQQFREDRHAVDEMADGLDVAVFICDRRGIVHYANKRAVEMFRFGDPSGRSILAITLSADLEAVVMEVFRTGEAMHAELTLNYPEERVNMASAWMQDNHERLFLAIYEITDLRRLERVRQDFVANVSHELRTPLATIRAMAETLYDEKGQDPQLEQRYLDKIMKEVDRLSLITNDLLILSTAENSPVRTHLCDIAEVFSSVTQQLEKKAKGKGIDLAYDGPAALRIEANPSQMTQVALNLIDNAINYTAEGSVSVSISGPVDALVTIQVSDTGMGISSQHLSRIFERFYRVDKGRSRATGGTGLGLSIVKHIVEAHGGTVTVESSLNQGSTFTVVLPVGNAVEAHEA